MTNRARKRAWRGRVLGARRRPAPSRPPRRRRRPGAGRAAAATASSCWPATSSRSPRPPDRAHQTSGSRSAPRQTTAREAFSSGRQAGHGGGPGVGGQAQAFAVVQLAQGAEQALAQLVAVADAVNPPGALVYQHPGGLFLRGRPSWRRPRAVAVGARRSHRRSRSAGSRGQPSCSPSSEPPSSRKRRWDSRRSVPPWRARPRRRDGRPG